ncbi:MAG: Gfo/Idh/MocA family oxidoreductase [Paracoccaceae bacterium]|jgi:myo-inositol 2-dehydrogenase / D-chiro-inositol 1-dehydrogenase|nr:Gfo/Idh/MocA family oxidoreductase [Paracoccaceae bacterium]
MDQVTRYGMIGCGMMGQEHLRNIALLSGTCVVAIFEPDSQISQAAAALAPEAVFYDTLDELLGQPDLDCLVIASPNYLHLDQLEQIATFPARPILVEKPLFSNPADLVRIEAFRAHYKAPVWVAMEYRYMPPISALREHVATATGGIKMLSIREHRFPFLPKVGDWNRFNAKTGGTFVEKCCHFFDLMRLLIDTDPVQVMASGGQAFNHLDETYNGAVPDIWDHGYVIVDFKNGARAMLELCMFAEGSLFQEEISAVGSVGKIEAFVPGPTRFWLDKSQPAPAPKIVLSPRQPGGRKEINMPVDPTLLAAGDHNGSTFYQHERFLAVVRHGSAVEVTLKDGIWAVRIGQATQKSMLSGQVVQL